MNTLHRVVLLTALSGLSALPGCGETPPATPTPTPPAGTGATNTPAPAAATGTPATSATTGSTAVGTWVVDPEESLKVLVEVIKAKSDKPLTPEQLKNEEAEARKEIPTGLSMELLEGGKYTMSFGGQSRDGTWTQTGKSITFVPKDRPDDTLTLTLEGDHMRPPPGTKPRDAAIILRRK